MTDQPKPLESPPPTDPNGKQSLPENQYLNDIDVGCNEMDDLMQQVKTLRNKHKHEGSQPSAQDKKDLLSLFDGIDTKVQDIRQVLKSQCEADQMDLTVKDADNSLKNPPCSVSENQGDVFMTANKLAPAVQQNVEGEQQTPAMSTDSKVQDLPEGDLVAEYEPSSTDDSQLVSPTPQENKNLYFPEIADDCVKLFEQAKQMKENAEAWGNEYQNDTGKAQLPQKESLEVFRQLGSMIANAKSLCVGLNKMELGTTTPPNIDEQTETDVIDQKQEIAEVLPVVDSLRSESPTDPSSPGETLLDDQMNTSSSSVRKFEADSKIDEGLNFNVTDFPLDKQQNYLKNLHLATLPFFFNAIEDIKARRRGKHNAHFNGLLSDFMDFVKEAKTNKKTKLAFREFDCNAFIKQQCEKDPENKKNYLLYETLDEFLSQQKYEKSIHDLLYYFSEKKLDEHEHAPAELFGNMMQGVEQKFFVDMANWETFFWEKSLKDYVKRQEEKLRDTESKVLPKRFTLGKKYQNYKSTKFFRTRRLDLGLSKLTSSPSMYMMMAGYPILQIMDDSRVLDSDMFYIETNWTGCEEKDLPMEYAVLSEMFSTDNETLQF